MPKTIYYNGLVKNGKFTPYEPWNFKKAFYAHEGKAVKVGIERWVKKRSTKQNKYYWTVVIAMIAEHTGDNSPGKKDTHDSLRRMFLSYVDDFGMPKVKSSTEPGTIGYEEYLENIRQWAAEFLELYIPEPHRV